MNNDQPNKSDPAGDSNLDRPEFKRDFHESWGIIIGIDHYTHGIPRLRTAINDARDLARILEQQHEYKVHLLVENVTYECLQELLNQTLPSQVGAGDRVFFYFAGHGVALDGDTGPSGFLIPQDARQEDRSTYLPMHAVHEALTGLPCRHLLAVLDCCFAGAFRWSSTRDVFPLPEVIHRERYERFIRDPAWQVITSAAYDQKALDIVAGDLYGERGEIQEHSPFALALFDALEGAGDVVPPGHGDGVITATELYLYLRDHVEVKTEIQVGQRQTPSLWPLNKHDKGEYIFLVPGQEPNLPPAPPLTFENNPYRGLQSYDEQHNDLFFGRSTLIQQLVEQVEANPLTVVLGASGTGKSSLVKAGLLPQLGGSHQPNDPVEPHEPWFILPPFRLGRSPMRSLSTLLSTHLPDLAQLVSQEKLGADPDALAVLAAEWSLRNPGCRLLLVIDQFEELVTICQDEIERTKFLNLLSRAFEAHPETIREILTLRSDFEPQFANSSLQPDWSQARFLIPPMSQDDLRQVIEGPASVRVLYFEPYELVNDLINEVILTPGALPLLSFTLSELYVKYVESERDNRALTREDYIALDGVIGSLRNRASAEYEQLDQDHRQTMRRIMLRMVAVEGGELARRRVPRSELVYKNVLENERVETVLRSLVNARLVVEGLDENGESFVEPAHDALVRAWDKLLEWRHLSEEYLPLQRRVAQAARDWDLAPDERAKNNLLWNNNPRLPQLQQALLQERTLPAGVLGLVKRVQHALWPSDAEIDPNTWLNRLETDFVSSSVVRRTRDLRRLVGVTLGVILVLSALTLVAILSRDAAIKSEETALAEAAMRGTAQAQEATARVEAEHSAATAIAEEQLRATAQAMEIIARVEAEHSAATAIAEEQLRATAQQQESLARADAEQKADLARSRELAALVDLDLRDGNIPRALQRAVQAQITASTTESEQALRSVLTQPWPRTIFERHDFNVVVARISPDGEHVFTASENETTGRIWFAESGVELATLQGHSQQITAASFSQNGERIVTSSADGTARVWKSATGELEFILEGHTQSIWDVDYNPNGERIVTASADGTVRVWDGNSGQELATLLGHTDSVSTAMYSPNGERIVTASSDSTVRVWHAESGRELVVLKGHTENLSTASFSPDGNQILTASLDGTARVWDANSGIELSILAGHSQAITSASFSPNGERILTASWDGTARVWNAESGEQLQILDGHSARVTAANFSPDGKLIVTAGWDGQAIIWEVEKGTIIASLAGHKEKWVNHASFSQDGTKVLTAAYGEARIWDLNSHGELSILEGHSDWIEQASFSPDGKRIVTASWDGTARIWNVYTGELLQTLQNLGSAVHTARFSPDGLYVVTANADGNARVLDANSGKELIVLRGHMDNLTTATFNPKGDRIVTASIDGDIRIWDVETGVEVTQCKGHSDRVVSANFSADGSKIISASDDQTARIWDVEDGHELSRLVGHTDWLVSAQFDKSGKRVVTASYDGTTRLWDAENGVELVLLNQFSQEVSPASFNPDGTQILTASGSPDIAQVWLADSGRELARFEGHTANILWASFSPDGNQVVTASRDGTARVWDINTGVEVAILEGHTDYVVYSEFSPDGKRIVTTSRDGDARLWPASADELLRLAEERLKHIGMGVSKESGRLAYVSYQQGNADIFLIDTDGSNSIQLTTDPAEDFAPTWSPDGARIAFCSNRNHNTDIYLIDIEGNSSIRLTDDPNLDCDPSWSPDGNRIAFSSDRDGDRDIYVVHIDGNNLVQLTDDPAQDTYPAWSPDGTRIAFSSDRISRDDFTFLEGDIDIYVMNADGSNIIHLTDTVGKETMPAWSPAGTQIAFNSHIFDDATLDAIIGEDINIAVGGDIFVVNLEDKLPLPVTDEPTHEIITSWSPNGEYLVMSSNRDGDFEIYLIDMTDLRIIQITDHPADDLMGVWQP